MDSSGLFCLQESISESSYFIKIPQIRKYSNKSKRIHILFLPYLCFESSQLTLCWLSANAESVSLSVSFNLTKYKVVGLVQVENILIL